MEISKEKIKKLFDLHKIETQGYLVDNTQLQTMSNFDTNRKDTFRGFKIDNSYINKQDKTCLFEDGIISKSRINIRSGKVTFINVGFYSSKFNSCSIKNAAFVNCFFEDIEFSVSGIHDTCFINCEFSECRMNDLTVSDIHFINSNSDEILDTKTEKTITQMFSSEIENTSMDIFDNSPSKDKHIKEKTTDHLATLPSEMEDTKKEIIKMQETLSNITINGEIENISNRVFNNCTIRSVTLASEIIEEAKFKSCTFIDCRFTDTKFFNVFFDNSIFKNCIFEVAKMSRCSLENVIISEDCTFDATLNSCHTFNTQINCSLEGAVFKNTEKPCISAQPEEHEKDSRYESVLEDMEKIISRMKTEEYRKSIEDKKDTTIEDIYTFFDKKDIGEVMELLANITSRCTRKKETTTSNDDVM